MHEVELLQYIQFHPGMRNLTGCALGQYERYPKAPYGCFEGEVFQSTTSRPGCLVSNVLFPVHRRRTAPSLLVEAALGWSSQLTGGMLTDAPLGFAEDPFYGHGVMGFLDAGCSGWNFQFYLTNRRVYAVYGRFPDQLDRLHAFMFAVPVAKRRPRQVSTYAIVLRPDDESGHVLYYIDGCMRLKVGLQDAALSGHYQFAERSGRTLDSRTAQLPRSVRVLLGSLVAHYNGQPHTVCQRTLHPCPDASPEGAVKAASRCQYNPRPMQSFGTFTMELEMRPRFLAVAQLRRGLRYPTYYRHYGRRRYLGASSSESSASESSDSSSCDSYESYSWW